MSRPKKGVRVFTLPGDEFQADSYLNNDLIDINDMQKYPCPKECVVLLYIYFTDYREEEE
jgi:hypothetical protein